jgi:hypothetical protein
MGVDMHLSKDLPFGAALPTLRIMRETPRFRTSKGKIIREFTGHIAFWHHAKEFHLRPAVGEEVPEPDCASYNRIKPDEGNNRQGELCATCPKNQNGSDILGGPRKGCLRQIRLYVLRDDEQIPCIIKVGPWRLNPRDGLLRWLTFASHPGSEGVYRTSKARLTLHTQKYDHGPASILDLETVRRLDPGVKADAQLLTTLDKLYKSLYRNYHGRIALNTPDSEYWQTKADRLWRNMTIKTGSCAYCGATTHLQAHHLISRSNSLTRHKVECGLCLCRYHHLYCRQISPHQQPEEFIKWLKKNVPDKYRWFQEHEQLEYQFTADYKEAFLALSQKDKSQVCGMEGV